MSNVKVRPNGWYLGRWSENSRLTVYYIYCNKVSEMGSYFDTNTYHWIADEPLDLDKIKFITENYEVFVD